MLTLRQLTKYPILYNVQHAYKDLLIFFPFIYNIENSDSKKGVR